MTDEPSLEDFEKTFLDELENVADIDTLKKWYAQELARRDKLIFDLQKQNKMLLKTAFKEKETSS